MPQGRGGARHKAKPFVDTGLLLRLLGKHEELIKDFNPMTGLLWDLGFAQRMREQLCCHTVPSTPQDFRKADTNFYPIPRACAQLAAPLRSAAIAPLSGDEPPATEVFCGPTPTPRIKELGELRQRLPLILPL